MYIFCLLAKFGFNFIVISVKIYTQKEKSMKKAIVGIIAILIGVSLVYFFIQAKNTPFLVIDSFEGKIIGGENATVDYGSGSGAKVDIFPAKEPVCDGKQSLKITYDASSGGYIWIARGYNLIIKNAAQWKIAPSKIKWDIYDALTFFIYGESSGNDIAVDIVDNGKEYWRTLIKDDTKGWKEVTIPFADFKTRTDWQPDTATRNNTIDFPVEAFQFAPKSGAGTIFIDKVSLHKKADVK
jgi:hypothetical protein